MTDAEQRRANNRAAYAALRATYDALSPDQHNLIKNEFALQRAGNPALSWARFLAVALLLLPAETSAA